MNIIMMKSKIHRATVMDTNINYEGSIGIDELLMRDARLVPFEQVHVVNLNNGERFITYVIKGDKPGNITLNGAAARLAEPGDKIIIISYCHMGQQEALEFKPRIVMVDGENQRVQIS